jgi:predicted MFS family arabinose efflux permease
VDYFPSPQRFQALVGGAIVLYALSYISVILVKEERLPDQHHKARASWTSYLRDLGRILLRRHDFRRFMGASVLVSLSMFIIQAFLTRYGLTYPGVEEGIAGTFTIFFFGAWAAGSATGGLLSDRAGPLVPFRIFPISLVLAAGLAVYSSDPATVSVAFACLGFAFGTNIVVRLPALFRFAGPERRPSYAAVSFALLGIGNAVVPPVIGMFLDVNVLSFRAMFCLCGVLAIAGWALFFGIPTPQADDG